MPTFNPEPASGRSGHQKQPAKRGAKGDQAIREAAETLWSELRQLQEACRRYC